MIAYDPYDREQMRDPYPVYRELRDAAPAYRLEKYDAWVLSRFEDIARASMDREHYSATAGIATGNLLRKMLVTDSSSFMSMDPPRHTALRRVVSPTFRPSAVAELEATIRERVALHARGLAQGQSFDVVRDLASRVSGDVACLVAGIPLEDRERLMELVEVFEPFFHDVPPPGAEAIRTQDAAGGELMAYALDLVARRRRSGGRKGDVLGRLLEAEFEGRALDDLAIAGNLVPLFIGGLETLPKHFGSLVYWLHHFPEQRELVARNASLRANAVEEALRFDSPAPLLGRRIVKGVEWHGQRMEPGQAILFLFQSGNRDERAIEDPDRFDVRRRSIRHLAFGTGIHSCIGLHYARLESRLMLDEILDRAPGYEVDLARAERGVLAGMHGYRSLPISF